MFFVFRNNYVASIFYLSQLLLDLLKTCKIFCCDVLHEYMYKRQRHKLYKLTYCSAFYSLPKSEHLMFKPSSMLPGWTVET